MAGKQRQSSENPMNSLFEEYGSQLISITAREHELGHSPWAHAEPLQGVKLLILQPRGEEIKNVRERTCAARSDCAASCGFFVCASKTC